MQQVLQRALLRLKTLDCVVNGCASQVTDTCCQKYSVLTMQLTGSVICQPQSARSRKQAVLGWPGCPLAVEQWSKLLWLQKLCSSHSKSDHRLAWKDMSCTALQ